MRDQALRQFLWQDEALLVKEEALSREERAEMDKEDGELAHEKVIALIENHNSHATDLTLS